MDFDRSTQAKSWIFSSKSLEACRQMALEVEMESSVKPTRTVSDRVRKFASGFHRRRQQESPTITNLNTCASGISCYDQEIMVQFHAHQIQFLVGPNALLYDLRTSETVLSTAITFFRRFYLSNSIVEVSPRRIAAACAFFAAKVEEEKVEIGLLSHATALVQMRVQNAPLCCKELRAVPVVEIEFAERLLMEGLNYEFYCYHSTSTIDEIFTEFAAVRSSDESYCRGDVSPRASFNCSSYDENGYLRQNALEVAQRALIFSDAPFLFHPSHIGFAIIAIVTGSVTNEGCMGAKLQAYLAETSPMKTDANLLDFSQSVRDVIQMLLNCPLLDLLPGCGRSGEIVSERAEELRRVLGEVATLRLLRKMKRRQRRDSLKRSRIELEFTPPRLLHARKHAKVTPRGKTTDDV